MAAVASTNARAIGRIDPKRAANYRPPWFNFSETYTDGIALGIVAGSPRVDAIGAAARAGLTVDPAGWGDNRAGGAELYAKAALRAKMLNQSRLNYYDASDLRRAVVVTFRDDRVISVRVSYINSEVP